MGATDYADQHRAEYATWQVMEEYLPTDLLRSYKKLFKECDVESTGVISVEKVARVARKLGKCLTTVEINELLINITECSKCNQVDIKFVDFPEFLAIISATATNCVSEDQMLSIFNKFDQDRDGFIGRQELQNLLLKVGEKVSEAEIDEMMKIADKDGDGLVSYEEFVRLLTGSCNNKNTKKNEEIYQNNTKKLKNEKMMNATNCSKTRSQSCSNTPLTKRHQPPRIFQNKCDSLETLSSSASSTSSASSSSLSSMDSGISFKRSSRKFTSSSILSLKSAISRKYKNSVDFSKSF